MAAAVRLRFEKHLGCQSLWLDSPAPNAEAYDESEGTPKRTLHDLLGLSFFGCTCARPPRSGSE